MCGGESENKVMSHVVVAESTCGDRIKHGTEDVTQKKPYTTREEPKKDKMMSETCLQRMQKSALHERLVHSTRSG